MPKLINVREMRPDERQKLEKLSRSRKAENRLVERAQMVLRRAEGEKPGQIAAEFGP